MEGTFTVGQPATPLTAPALARADLLSTTNTGRYTAAGITSPSSVAYMNSTTSASTTATAAPNVAAPPSPLRSVRSAANSVATSALLEPHNPGFTTPAAGQYSRASFSRGGGGLMGGGGGGGYGSAVGGNNNHNSSSMGVTAAGMLGLTEISARMNRLLASEQPVRPWAPSPFLLPHPLFPPSLSF